MKIDSSSQRLLTPIWSIALYIFFFVYLCTAVMADRYDDAMEHLDNVSDNITRAAEDGDIDRLDNIGNDLGSRLDTMSDALKSDLVDREFFLDVESRSLELFEAIIFYKSDPIVRLKFVKSRLDEIEKAIEKLSKECKADEIDKLREELWATKAKGGIIRPVIDEITREVRELESQISELERLLSEEEHDNYGDDLVKAQDAHKVTFAVYKELMVLRSRLNKKALEAAKKCRDECGDQAMYESWQSKDFATATVSTQQQNAWYNFTGGRGNADALENGQLASITDGLPPHIERVEKNPCAEQKEAPNDPYFRARGSWGQTYDDQWAIKHVGFTAERGSAWDIEDGTNHPIVVAVIDTGLDWNHKDIDWDNIWRNENEIPDNGKDDDNNGYVDDIIGWNFMGNNNKPWDDGGHGTFITGVIAAATNNNVGIAGINRGAKIMVLKALDAFGYTRVSFLAEAVFYAARNGARVINISAGGEHLTTTMQEAVDYAYDRGAVIVVAAGNEAEDTKDIFPVGLRNVIGVSTTDNKDKRTGFSNWGQNIDIAAPGMDVLSLRARRTDLMLGIPEIEYSARTAYVGEDTRYYRATGTSFSAPIVAATASLILARDPTLTNIEVERMILQSARDIEVTGWDQYTGFGLLDARAALMADPDYYLLALIKKVHAVQKDGEVYLEVLGTADSNVFKKARIDLGKGEEPKKWKKVAVVKKPVSQGRLALIPATKFKKSGKWTLRLQARDKKGKVRESRASVDID